MAANKSIAELRESAAASEARKTLAGIFDEDSFIELSPFGADSVLTGFGQIEGNTAYAFIQDSEVKSGAVNKASADKIAKIYSLAVRSGTPIVGIYDSSGGEATEGVELLSAYAEIMNSAARLSGVVPQIALVKGVCGGTIASIACMSDFLIMTEKAELFVTPPFVNGISANAKDAAKAGLSCMTVKDVGEGVSKVRKLLAVLPQNNLEVGGNDYFQPSNSPADLSSALSALRSAADKDSLIEIYPDLGVNAKIFLGSLNWRTVGFVAAGDGNKLSSCDATKIAKFVTMCDCFSLPIITFVDSEGFDASGSGVRSCSQLAQVYASATSPKLSVITGKAFGGIYPCFCGANADLTFASEKALIAPLAPSAAAVFLCGDDCNSKEELENAARKYADEDASALNVLKKGKIDQISLPDEFLDELTAALENLSNKRVVSPARKHINFVY